MAASSNTKSTRSRTAAAKKGKAAAPKRANTGATRRGTRTTGQTAPPMMMTKKHLTDLKREVGGFIDTWAQANGLIQQRGSNGNATGQKRPASTRGRTRPSLTGTSSSQSQRTGTGG